LGWRSEEHSDLKNRALFLISPWYLQFLKGAAQIP
jgi:hypothetical protein